MKKFYLTATSSSTIEQFKKVPKNALNRGNVFVQFKKDDIRTRSQCSTRNPQTQKFIDTIIKRCDNVNNLETSLSKNIRQKSIKNGQVVDIRTHTPAQEYFNTENPKKIEKSQNQKLKFTLKDYLLGLSQSITKSDKKIDLSENSCYRLDFANGAKGITSRENTSGKDRRQISHSKNDNDSCSEVDFTREKTKSEALKKLVRFRKMSNNSIKTSEGFFYNQDKKHDSADKQYLLMKVYTRTYGKRAFFSVDKDSNLLAKDTFYNRINQKDQKKELEAQMSQKTLLMRKSITADDISSILVPDNESPMPENPHSIVGQKIGPVQKIASNPQKFRSGQNRLEVRQSRALLPKKKSTTISPGISLCSKDKKGILVNDTSPPKVPKGHNRVFFATKPTIVNITNNPLNPNQRNCQNKLRTQKISQNQFEGLSNTKTCFRSKNYSPNLQNS